MDNTVFVDLFLIISFLLYIGLCWHWNWKNKPKILQLKTDPSFAVLTRSVVPVFGVIFLITLIWLGLMSWRLLECLVLWHAGGISAYLILVLFVAITLYQVGVAQFCKLILVYAVQAGISK